MRVIATMLGVLASLVMLGVSGSMNFLFMSSLGKTALEGQVLGAASAAADGLKALLPFFMWWAWDQKRRVPAVAGLSVWLFFVGFSLLSAIGFAATNRGAVTDTREGLAATYATVEADVERARARLGALPAHRPAQVVKQAIEALKQNRRWTSTRRCKDATANASRAFCEGFFKVRAELAAAIEGERLRAQMAGLEREAGRLRAAGAGRDADPQVSILSRLFGQGESAVRLALIVVVALLVELGSSMGLWLSTAHFDKSRKARRRPEVTPAEAAPAQRPEKREQERPRLAIEARMMGDVQDYCLARIQPVPEEVSVSLQELLADYRAWCEGRGLAPFDAGEFAAHFRAIASEVELSERGGRFIGIKLGRAGEAVAA